MKRREQRRLGERIRARLGERIRARREELGLTQEHLAARADVSAVHLSSVERGEIDAGLNVLKRIAAALDVPLGALVDEPVELSRKALTFALEFDQASPELKAALLVLLNDLARSRTRGRS